MRKKRPLKRDSKMMRDTNLIIIASEDTYAVKQYFELFRTTRIQFRVLETQDCKSSPTAVMARLEDYMKEYDFGEGDQFWLVCDTDHWIKAGHIKNLVDVVKKCRQKEIQVAISNPCFDLWLLLHFAEFPTSTTLTCKRVGDLIQEAAGRFDKTKVHRLSITNQQVADAIRKSKENFSPEKKNPTQPQTAFHLIIEDWFNKGILSITG